MKQIVQVEKNKVFPLLANGETVYMLKASDPHERLNYCQDMTVKYVRESLAKDDCIFFTLEDQEDVSE